MRKCINPGTDAHKELYIVFYTDDVVLYPSLEVTNQQHLKHNQDPIPHGGSSANEVGNRVIS